MESLNFLKKNKRKLIAGAVGYGVGYVYAKAVKESSQKEAMQVGMVTGILGFVLAIITNMDGNPTHNEIKK